MIKTNFKVALIFLSLLSLQSLAQKKHALVITISNYPAESGWNLINANNDKLLVEKMLSEQGFLDTNILFIEDHFATHSGIVKGFEELISKIQLGDIVYIHYSGHGQQIMDVGVKDEDDGYDECIVAYNTPKNWFEGYDGGKHLRDDELRILLKSIRIKLGNKGQLIVVFDSCHSGTGTRGGDNNNYSRGGSRPCAPEWYTPINIHNHKIENYDIDIEFTETLSNITFYSGSRADQVNYEYFDFKTREWYGSLTFHFVKAVQVLDSASSHRNLYSKIKDGYLNNSRTRNQEPNIESDNIDELVFNGTVIKQYPFFEVSNINGSIITILGGGIHGLLNGDSIGFFANDVLSIENKKALFLGVVKEIDVTSSKVILNENIDVLNRDRAKYRAFVTKSVKVPTKVFVKLEIQNNKLKKLVSKYLKSLENVEISEHSYEYILKESSNDTVDIMVSSSGLRNSFVSFAGDENKAFTELDKNLNKLIRLKAFMDIAYDNPNIDLGFKNSPAGIKTNGENDSFTIQNKGDNSIYVYYYYVGPNMISSFVPIGNSNNIYKKIYPNSEFSFPLTYSCNEDDPCGINRLKLIVANNEISGIENLLEMNTVNYGTRGTDESGLLQYFDNKLVGTRGADKPNVEAVNFYFEVQAK